MTWEWTVVSFMAFIAAGALAHGYSVLAQHARRSSEALADIRSTLGEIRDVITEVNDRLEEFRKTRDRDPVADAFLDGNEHA